MAKCNTQENDMATMANNWTTSGSSVSGRYNIPLCLCNALVSMRQVSPSYSQSLPCHVLACCILPCHHVHCIAYVFVSGIRTFSPLSVLQSGTPMSPGASFCLFFVCVC